MAAAANSGRRYGGFCLDKGLIASTNLFVSSRTVPGGASERPPVQARAWKADRSVSALAMLSTASQLADFGKIMTLRVTLQNTPKQIPEMRVAATMAASVGVSSG